MTMLEDLLKESPLCYALGKKVQEYFQDAENRQKFEDWYKEKYGKAYEWR